VHLERSIVLSPGEMRSRHLLMGLLAARAESDLRAAAEAALRVARTDAVAQAYAAGGTPLVAARAVFIEIGSLLEEKGLLLKQGTIVGATIIAARVRRRTRRRAATLR
jgi:hypothetical protein